ncbi:hypothetical protein [Alsobacter sp. R-9]
MSDLVERLEAAARHPDNQHGPHEWLAEAAARIKALEDGLRSIVENEDQFSMAWAAQVARALLGGSNE